MASATDSHLVIGDTCSDLAEVLELAGEKSEARTAFEQALAAYERKGARWLVDVTRRRLDELAGSTG